MTRTSSIVSACRKLPVDARQYAGLWNITSEPRTEPLWGSRLRRVGPLQPSRVPGNRNKSGTAEVNHAFVS